MSGQIFISAFRYLLRHKVQTLINIASLALGLAVFGFAFLYVKQELSYDRAWPDAQRIHRLLIEQRGIPGLPDGRLNVVPPRTWQQITDYFSIQIDQSTRVVDFPVKLKDAPSASRRKLTFADPAFLDIFRLETIAGDLHRVLSGPGFIALEENHAKTLGSGLVPGDRIILESVHAEVEYEIAAIYRLPETISSAVDFVQLTLMHEYSMPLFDLRRLLSWENRMQVWVTLNPGMDTAAFNALQPAFIDETVTGYDQAIGADRKISDHLFYRWQPVTALHFNPADAEAGLGAGDRGRVATFAIVGLLVLLVGSSNSVSLGLAGAMVRQREVGIRKAAGATPEDIRRQHFGESVLFALLGLVPAITLLKLLLPAFQNLLPFATPIDIRWNDYALLALIACVVGLANGVWPALVLSAVRAEVVLKAGGGRSIKGGLSLRTLLAGAQFCLASILLIVTAALYLQLAVTRSQPMGFNAENLVTLFLDNGVRGSVVALRAELEKLPGVRQVVPITFPLNANIPFSSLGSALVREPGAVNEIESRMTWIDSRFFALMEIPLLAGRSFDALRDRQQEQTPQNRVAAKPPQERVILNRAAVRALGFSTPDEAVGQVVYTRRTIGEAARVVHTPQRIIGVVEDNMYASLRQRPEPETYLLATTPASMLMLKYETVVENSLQASIQETAQASNGQPLRNLMYVEPQIQSAYRQEQIESRLLLVCGSLALGLACIGLYGLAAFVVERQVKEVGVRRAMGADIKVIVALFLWRFSKPVLFANIIAWPLAIYFVLMWIERFPYQLERVWLLPLCLASALVVLLISMITVSSITYRAAVAKPVQSLRYE